MKPYLRQAKLCALFLIAGTALAAEPLRICASVPELGDLARTIGGKHVAVTVLANGNDDPHAVTPRASFITDLAAADALIYVGLELELGWLPALQQTAQNPKLRWGAPGDINASGAISPIKPAADQLATGHVHAAGNPHYLTDPINGWLVAQRLAQRFATLRPEHTADFNAHFAQFTDQLARAFVGDELTKALGSQAVCQHILDGTLGAIIDSKVDSKVDSKGDSKGDAKMGDLTVAGWLGQTAHLRGISVVVDHDQWPYLAKRCGFTVAGTLEIHPGIPSSGKHLAQLLTIMQEQNVHLILCMPFTDLKPAQVLAEQAQATVVILPHQVGAMPGCDTYMAWCNVVMSTLAAAPR